MKYLFYSLISAAIIIQLAAIGNFVINFDRIESTTTALSMIAFGLAMIAMPIALQQRKK